MAPSLDTKSDRICQKSVTRPQWVALSLRDFYLHGEIRPARGRRTGSGRNVSGRRPLPPIFDTFQSNKIKWFGGMRSPAREDRSAVSTVTREPSLRRRISPSPLARVLLKAEDNISNPLIRVTSFADFHLGILTRIVDRDRRIYFLRTILERSN